ncbi:hypothetical protein CVCC1112_3088 [Paenarthrobacter nicotinovorans]|nr:hypothetical protein CVCC1112_3088 [Paenarthrobacter nicotinovorans]
MVPWRSSMTGSLLQPTNVGILRGNPEMNGSFCFQHVHRWQ